MPNIETGFVPYDTAGITIVIRKMAGKKLGAGDFEKIAAASRESGSAILRAASNVRNIADLSLFPEI